MGILKFLARNSVGILEFYFRNSKFYLGILEFLARIYLGILVLFRNSKIPSKPKKWIKNDKSYKNQKNDIFCF